MALLLALLPSLAAFAQQRKDASPDARIRYYRQRLGGPSTYPAYARLGLAYAERARATGRVLLYLDAARYLERSLAMQRNYEALLGLSAVSLALHRFPEALAHAREAIDTMPGDSAAQGALFDALLGSGDHHAAEKVLEGMSTKAGFGYLIRQAALLEYRGETAEALRSVEQACALHETEAAPSSTRAWCQVRWGALQLAHCEPKKARLAYDRALALLPGYFLAREHLAELAAAQDKTEEAHNLYLGLVSTTHEPRFRFDLAALYEATGQAKTAKGLRLRARADLRRRAAADIRDAWHELALLEGDDPGTAAEAVRWAEKDWQNRQDLHAAEALAWAWLQYGNRSKAEDALERALAPGGASPSLLLHAARIRLRTGHADQARELFARALACPVALTPQTRRLADRVKSELGPQGR